MSEHDERLIELLDLAQATGNELRLIENGKLSFIRIGRQCCEQRKQELRTVLEDVVRTVHMILNTQSSPLPRKSSGDLSRKATRM